MIWNFEASEAVKDYITDSFTTVAAEQLLNAFVCDAYELSYAPTTALHLVLVHSNSDYSFKASELEWLNNAVTVLCYRLQSEKIISVFFLEMDCRIDEYYTNCAAIVKIFNRAFASNNLFVFKMSDAIAIGSSRLFGKRLTNNFTVSGLVLENNIEVYEELIDDLSYFLIDEIPDAIISFSSQERGSCKDYYDSNVDVDYLDALIDINMHYGLDTSQERAKYLLEQNNEPIWDTYRTASIILSDVAEESPSSSYDVLDRAIEAEERAENIKFENESEILSFDLLELSDEAFINAEQMLKEMLEKDKH